MLVTVVLAAVFIWGVTRLFQLRFEAGNVYPPYSSLRRDPLGTKAFFESLQELAGDRVERNYQVAPTSVGERGRTWLVLGLPAAQLEQLDAAEFRELESLLTGQGRLVLGFLPAVESRGNKPAAGRPAPVDAGRDREERLSLDKRWGLQIGFNQHVGRTQVFVATRNGLGGTGSTPSSAPTVTPDLPATIPWHSTVFFDKLSPAWQVVYACDGRPVIIERKLAGGTVVLVGDSYLFSNEALQKERQPAWLAWTVGQPTRVIFDESHFGIEERPGVMTLVRRYRLHGLVAVLALVAGLFVWRTALPFVPPPPGAGPAPQRAASSAAGLVTLLRRSVPPRALLAACLADWKKACGHGRADLPAKEPRLAAFAEQTDLVAAYREMQRIVEEK